MDIEKKLEHYKRYLGIFYDSFMSITPSELEVLTDLGIESGQSYMFIGDVNVLKKVTAYYLSLGFIDYEYFTVDTYIADRMKRNEEDKIYTGKELLILCELEASNKYGNLAEWSAACISSTIATRYAMCESTLLLCEVSNDKVREKCKNYIEIIDLRNKAITSVIVKPIKVQQTDDYGGVDR